jgi:hypothetical protein
MENNIFQTHKSMEYINSKEKIKNAVDSWKNHADFDYNFYNDKECEEFIKNNFDSNVYEAYMKCPINVMKADLWRYCVIYKYGGIYADTDTVCKCNPDIFLKNDALLILVPENNVHLCNWVFAAPVNSPILKTVIDLSVSKILAKTEIKGEHVIHELTGPGLFSEGIELYLKNNNLPTYEDKTKYFNYPNKILYVYEPNIFHHTLVVHLFTGGDSDGWTQERDKKLK